MASEVYVDVYPQWLIRKERQTRRRTVTFSLAYDASKVAGYSVKNPLTGTNYAYQMRCDSLDLAEWGRNDDKLKNAFLQGSLYLGVLLLYASLVGKTFWYYPLVLLGAGVVETEVWAWLDERKFTQYKTVDEYQRAVEIDYNSIQGFKNMVNEAYNGDTEYYATKTWFMSKQDKISRYQGISLLYNLAAGWALHRSLFLEKRFNTPTAWIGPLGGGAVVWSDFRAAYQSSGPNGKMGGAQTDHKGHILSFSTGVVLSYILGK